MGGTAVRGVARSTWPRAPPTTGWIDRVRDLFARLCGAGQVTELQVVEADHGPIIRATAGPVTAFLDARHGREPVDSCP